MYNVHGQFLCTCMYVLFVEVSLLTTCTCILMTAGNACVLKPSELSVATSNLLKELVPLYLDQVRSTCTWTLYNVYKVHESETGISLHVHVHVHIEFPRILKYTSHVHVHVHVCILQCFCIWNRQVSLYVHVRVSAHTVYVKVHSSACMYMYMYMYVCACMCLQVCV